jgi:hypothetical protein
MEGGAIVVSGGPTDFGDWCSGQGRSLRQDKRRFGIAGVLNCRSAVGFRLDGVPRDGQSML